MLNEKIRRVCLIQLHDAWGACEEYWRLLAGGIDPERFAVSVLYPDGEEVRSQFAQLPPWVQQRPCPRFWFQSLRSGIGPLRQALVRLGPDLVHCNDPGLVAMIAGVLARVPVRVLTFHTPAQAFEYRFYARWLQRWVLRRWQVVALSPTNRQLLQRRYGLANERVHTIAHGLESDRFSIANRRDAVRAELAVPPDCILLGCVARLAAQKNHALLLDAYAGLTLGLRSRAHLLIVGDGELRAELEAQVKQLGLCDRVTFTGHRQDIPQLLQAMDGFVLSSNYEGLPFAVLEAMAMALPVVATAVDGVCDAIVSGETGFLVPPGEEEPLRDAIAQLIENPEARNRLGNAGRARFLSHYTVERMVRETETLYETLLANQPQSLGRVRS